MSRRVSCSGVALRLSSNISLRRTARGCCAAGWPAPTGRSPRRRCSRGSLTARCRRGATAYSCNPSGHGIISPTAATPADNPSCSCKLTRSGHEVARALQLRSLRMWGNPCCSCGLTRVRWRCSGSRNGRARSAAKQVGTILLQNGPDCLGLCLGVTRLRPGCPALHSAVLPTSSQPRCQSAPLLRPSPHVLTSIRQAAARPAVAELGSPGPAVPLSPLCSCRCCDLAAVLSACCFRRALSSRCTAVFTDCARWETAAAALGGGVRGKYTVTAERQQPPQQQRQQRSHQQQQQQKAPPRMVALEPRQRQQEQPNPLGVPLPPPPLGDSAPRAYVPPALRGRASRRRDCPSAASPSTCVSIAVEGERQQNDRTFANGQAE